MLNLNNVDHNYETAHIDRAPISAYVSSHSPRKIGVSKHECWVVHSPEHFQRCTVAGDDFPVCGEYLESYF